MLTELQSRVARTMAVNRSEESYFAGGAVLNEHTVRLSDDLDVFTDADGIIPDVVDLDVSALRRDGLKVTVDLEIHGCPVEATVDLRQLNDGGGRFPDSPDAVSAFA